MRATALVAFSACCFGSIGVLTLLATKSGLSLPAAMAWRYVPGSLALLALAGVPALRTSPRRALAMALVGGGCQALVAWVTLSSLRWISAATLGFLFYTYPAWIAVFAAVRGTERVDRRQITALALSLGGIALMVGGPGRLAWQGVALALGGAVIYALYLPYIHRLQEESSPSAAATYVTGGAGLIFTTAAIATGTVALPSTGLAWLAVGLLAVVCTALAFMTLFRGLATLGPVRSSIVSTVEPFWTAVLGALVLRQSLTLANVAGGALIAGAVLLLQLDARARAHE